MKTEANEKQIRTAFRPECVLCGAIGNSVYLNLQDRLFGAAGIWQLKRCANRDCGILWLDPMPLAEDIGKAYADYYTHVEREAEGKAGPVKQVYRQMKRGYRASRYGYKENCFVRSLGKALYLLPLRRSEVDAEARLLRAVPQGRLLDIGCGSGDWLLCMRELGWQVMGIDFDEDAVSAARQKGLEVFCGVLEEQKFPGESFDAVTLNHVIEHVPQPIQTLAECVRILKKGAKLVMFTPNSASLGHRLFKQNWRGLEPPRHLHLFNPRSMKTLLKAAGFHEPSVRTINSRYVWQHSYRLRTHHTQHEDGVFARVSSSVAWRALSMFEQCLLMVGISDIGECLAVEAYKI